MPSGRHSDVRSIVKLFLAIAVRVPTPQWARDLGVLIGGYVAPTILPSVQVRILRIVGRCIPISSILTGTAAQYVRPPEQGLMDPTTPPLHSSNEWFS